jgi:hypothetical protein
MGCFSVPSHVKTAFSIPDFFIVNRFGLYN